MQCIKKQMLAERERTSPRYIREDELKKGERATFNGLCTGTKGSRALRAVVFIGHQKGQSQNYPWEGNQLRERKEGAGEGKG